MILFHSFFFMVQRCPNEHFRLFSPNYIFYYKEIANFYLQLGRSHRINISWQKSNKHSLLYYGLHTFIDDSPCLVICFGFWYNFRTRVWKVKRSNSHISFLLIYFAKCLEKGGYFKWRLKQDKSNSKTGSLCLDMANTDWLTQIRVSLLSINLRQCWALGWTLTAAHCSERCKFNCIFSYNGQQAENPTLFQLSLFLCLALLPQLPSAC